jgi:hypothetical protein
MYILFAVFASHEHCEFHSQMFVEEDQDKAEKVAKQWLYQEARHFLRDNIYKNEEYVKHVFDNGTLRDVSDFLHENSEYVHVQYLHYTH